MEDTEFRQRCQAGFAHVFHYETLEPGEIGIFVINGEDFVKEYSSKGVYSHNEAKYPLRKFCSGDDVRIVGRVLGKVTKTHRPTREESMFWMNFSTTEPSNP